MLSGVFVEKLLVKEDPGIYGFINQGCLGVDGMDDKEEMRLTDVCIHGYQGGNQGGNQHGITKEIPNWFHCVSVYLMFTFALQIDYPPPPQLPTPVLLPWNPLTMLPWQPMCF